MLFLKKNYIYYLRPLKIKFLEENDKWIEGMINELKIELYVKIDLKNIYNCFINFSLLPYKEMAKKN